MTYRYALDPAAATLLDLGGTDEAAVLVAVYEWRSVVFGVSRAASEPADPPQRPVQPRNDDGGPDHAR